MTDAESWLITLILAIVLFVIIYDSLFNKNSIFTRNKGIWKKRKYSLFSDINTELEYFFYYSFDYSDCRSKNINMGSSIKYNEINNVPFDQIVDGPPLKVYIIKLIKNVPFFIDELNNYYKSRSNYDNDKFLKIFIIHYFVFMNLPAYIDSSILSIYLREMIDNYIASVDVMMRLVDEQNIEKERYSKLFGLISFGITKDDILDKVIFLRLNDNVIDKFMIDLENNSKNTENRKFKIAFIHFQRCRNFLSQPSAKIPFQMDAFIQSYNQVIDNLGVLYFSFEDSKENPLMKGVARKMLTFLKYQVKIDGINSEKLFEDYLSKKDYQIDIYKSPD